MKNLLMMAAAGLGCGFLPGVEIELAWTLKDGSTSVEKVQAEEKDGVTAFAIPKAAIVAKGAKRLAVTPDFATAKKGDAGYWVVPTGQFGTFRCDAGRHACSWPTMSMFGMKTPAKTYVAIVKGLKYYFTALVEAKDGVYRQSCVLNEEQCTEPYEDFAIEWRTLSGDEADYSGMARAYRKYQLDRGAVKPFRERVKGNETLRYAVLAPEIRIRQAWKPVPSPVPEQVPENEPAIKKVAVTFDRVGDIARELKRQGVGKAELCLVGWNIGGHDGRWPQCFPPEEKLGGEAKLRQCIRDTRDCGYLIVPHGNFRDAYRIAENWDVEYLIKDKDGDPVQAHSQFWGGGRQFQICPRRGYEFHSSREMPRMAALGFRGMGYFDVVTILLAPKCDDPRHPLNRAEAARFWGKSAELSRKFFGGFASEGSLDHFAGSLDSVLYASFGDPRSKNKGLVDGMLPVWQLCYNGIIANNPFTTTVNFTAQDRYSRLKLLEYGGRPNFYFYSKFVDDGTDWMGKSDLGCATDAELRASVAKIKEGWDVWSKVNHLQFEYMKRHAKVAEDVYLTEWEEGTRLLTNYRKEPFAFEGATIAAEDFLLLPGAPRPRRLVLADESRAQLHYYDSSDPAKCFSIPGEKPLWDLKQVGPNRYRAIGRKGFQIYDLESRKVVDTFRSDLLDEVTAMCDLPDGGFVASVNPRNPPDKNKVVLLVRFNAARKHLVTYRVEGCYYARSLEWDRDGKTLLLSWEKGFARVQLPEHGTTCRIVDDFRQPKGRNLFDVLPARNGDGYVAGCGYGGGLVRYDAKGQAVSSAFVPEKDGKGSHFYAQVKELPDGTVYMAHWTGHGEKDSYKGWQAVAFGPDGKVLWHLDDPARFGSCSGIDVVEAPEF